MTAEKPRLLDRIGAAIANPQRAMEDADRGIGGAPDVLLLLFAKFVATELPAIVAAFWTFAVVGPRAALPAFFARLSASIGTDLAIILIAGVVTTIAAGRRRSPGRDFDLATVAWIPPLFLTVAASMVQTIFRVRFGSIVDDVIAGVAIAWMAFGVLVAIRVARRRVREEAPSS